MSTNEQRPTNLQLGCEENKGALRIDTNSGKYPTTAPKGSKSSNLVIYFQVGEDHRLPRYLCTDCYKQCIDWKLFLDLVRESDKTHRIDLADREVIVKEEAVLESAEICESDVNISQNETAENIKSDPEDDELSIEIIKMETESDFSDHHYSDQNLFEDLGRSPSSVEYIKTGENPVQCKICCKIYSKRSTFLKHVRVHDPYRLKCSGCGKQFKHRNGLVGHLLTHSGQKPFSCRFCISTFALKKNLVSHERFHTGDRPYECNQCEKKHKSKNGLDYNKTKHTGEKPFSCISCKRKFASKSYAKKHEKTHKN